MTDSIGVLAARLVVLKEGERTSPLFVFPGTGGDARELSVLAARLSGPGAVIGVEIPHGVGHRAWPPRVEEMSARAIAAIRAAQPTGGIRLLGYSFGGLLALEVARRLKAEGGAVAGLGLIDTIYDRRCWPMRIFVRAQLRRVVVHTRAIRGRPSIQAAGALFGRVDNLMARLRSRLGDRTPMGSSTPCSVQGDCEAAMAAYVPSTYDDRLTLFRSSVDQDFGCDPADLWRPLTRDLDVVALAGPHLALVRDPASLDNLAAEVERWLQSPGPARPLRPSALVVTTLRWLSTARLGVALSDAGFSVSAVCPAGHPLRRGGFLRRAWRSGVVSPLAPLRTAIALAKPDLIVPCDDRAVSQLLSLHATATGEDPSSVALRSVIERSLAGREYFDILQARGPVSDLAAREGAAMAETVVVADYADLSRCAEIWGFPLVLKSDGSWGGLGVRIVNDLDNAARAFRRLRRPPLAWALWRMIKDNDAGFLASVLRRERFTVSVQRFVRGVPANVAVACWQGRVLASVGVEAVHTAGDRGPATVVRRVESPDMTAAVARLANRLKLSGLCGFDFMRDEVDGRYYLIEINARATPTCHLTGSEGVDPLAALRATVAGEAPTPGEKTTAGEVIALFPQEMLRDPDSPYLAAARHDVPGKAEFLTHAAHAELARRRRLEIVERCFRGPARMSVLARATTPTGKTKKTTYRPTKAPA